MDLKEKGGRVQGKPALPGNDKPIRMQRYPRKMCKWETSSGTEREKMKSKEVVPMGVQEPVLETRLKLGGGGQERGQEERDSHTVPSET